MIKPFQKTKFGRAGQVEKVMTSETPIADKCGNFTRSLCAKRLCNFKR